MISCVIVVAEEVGRGRCMRERRPKDGTTMLISDARVTEAFVFLSCGASAQSTLTKYKHTQRHPQTNREMFLGAPRTFAFFVQSHNGLIEQCEFGYIIREIRSFAIRISI